MKKILVVDDEECLVEMLCEYLNIKGYSASGFVSPVEALDEISKNKYDVVITDYNMPEMDGNELSNEISKMKNHPKVIMLTGYQNLKVLEENKNIDVLFKKPTRYSELMEIINGF